MGIAAIIITTVAKWLGLRSMLVPGVGVREGLLLDLVAEQYSGGVASAEEKGRADGTAGGRALVCAAPGLQPAARRAGVAAGAFALRSTAPDSRNGPRGAAGAGNGRAAARRGTFRAQQVAPSPRRIPDPQRTSARACAAGGAIWWRRWCAITTANRSRRWSIRPTRRSTAQRRRQVRLLTSLLRIAEKLESEHAQRIAGVDVQIAGRQSDFPDSRVGRHAARSRGPRAQSGFIRERISSAAPNSGALSESKR